MVSGLFAVECEQPGAVFLLVSGVAFTVVELAFLPHGPEDFEPTLSQAAQGGSMAGSACPVGLVKGLCPGAILPAAVGP